MKNAYFLLLISVLSFKELHAQLPVFVSVNANTATPSKFEKFELAISLTAAYSNPYDYDDIAVTCIFTAPGGRKDTVDGFYMQNYSLNTTNGNLTASGAGIFKLRYTPGSAGTWQYQLSCTSTTGSTNWPNASFNCMDAPAKGFIRKNASNYLGFDNGEQYIPVGENVAWQQSNRYTDYKSWTSKLADNKANLMRLWLCHWGYGIEWKNNYDNFSGLKKYKQSNAYYLDWLLEECKNKGLYIMLCINHHGQVSTTTDANWNDNPYNAANGGPCTNTWDFFTNTAAKAAHRNRLRYIVARWGYSTNIQSWELFNEVEWTDQFATHKTEIKDWHNEMAQYLHMKDPAKHLVTTSYANDANDPATWNLASIDFTQTHYYNGSPNIETVLSGGGRNYISSFNKPTINGEFGLSASSVATLVSDDPTGTNIHNSLWATMFSGAMGPALPWYWNDYIDPQNLYYHFKPVSDVSALIAFKDRDYKPATATVTSSVVSDASFSPGVNYGGATASSFIVNPDGTLNPGVNQLGRYLFGSVYNVQNRNPPTFSVNYPVAGQFKIATGNATGTSPNIIISVDGVQVFSQPALINSTYSINISAGSHNIKVDNTGTDWILISSYTFTNVGSPLNKYILKSADSYSVTGWVHNKSYNWSYLKSSGMPPAINDGMIQVPGIQNGSYIVRFYNCSNGTQSGTAAVNVTNGTMSFALPPVAWDVAFSTTESSVLPIQQLSFTGLRSGSKNILTIAITTQSNVKDIFMERSVDAVQFSVIGKVTKAGSPINGRHIYEDLSPSKSVNFYRLRILDYDGTVTYSPVVRLSNDASSMLIYPNPFTNQINITGMDMKSRAKLVDANGKTVLLADLGTGLGVARLQAGSIAPGNYWLVLRDTRGKLLAAKTLVKYK